MLIKLLRWARAPLLVALAASAATGWAQSSEGGAIRLVIPGGAGGTVDAVARRLAEGVTEPLKRPVIVDNKPGASGAIAADTVSRAAADGSTVLVGVDSIFATNPHIFRNRKMEGGGLKPLVMLGSFPIALVVHESIPARTLTEFVKYAQARPGELTYGSPGVGSTHQLVAEALASEATIQMTHVPYKGVEGMTLDFIGGRLSAGFFSLASAEKLVRANSGHIVAISGAKRATSLPSVPAFSEVHPRLSIDSWVGVFVPQGTEAAIANELKSAFVSSMKDPTTVGKLADAGFIAGLMDTESFARRIQADLAARGALIQRLGITAP